MTSKKGEQVRQKSPAEFFSENQIIAGFDNPGKSLYTSIRELVENSLDAAESIQVLPDIELEITEMTEAQFNKKRGLAGRAGGRLDTGLFENPAGAKKGKGGKKKAAATDDADEEDNGAEDPAEAGAGKGGGKGSKSDARTKVMYYTVSCRDNGCGLPHKDIPDMLGRVLSGSKYGVRQTRGKFGLGAKMALIWAKKSTGMPIEIRCAHSADSSVAPTTISNCILDIDIHRNEPKVEVHERLPNPSGWRGAEISVTVGGNWTTYRGKVLSYFQQLAVITPYASFKLAFHAALDSVDSKGQAAATSNAAAAAQRCVEVHYVRRSSTIPDLPTEVKFHPSSVDNMLVSQLLQKTRVNSLASFLTTELQGVDKSVAARIVAELGAWAQEDTPKGVAATSTKVMALTQALRDVTLFKPPDGKCLSPAGEYNLRLGIQKEVDPVLVATYTMPKPSANEGHPFVVECGVALGGAAAKDGITVHRFANRIPLLFEPGSDVATRVANRKIKWGSYKIDPKKDKIGIFVSIVSTKIPFKGTSKEYIGEDCEPIAEAVRKALMNCAAQLKHHIVRRESEKEQKNRLKNLTKYVPDVSDALFKVLQKVYDRDGSEPPAIPPSSSSSSTSSSPKKRGRPEEEGGAGWSWFGAKRSMMAKMHDGSLTKDVLIDALTKHAEASDFLGGGGGNGGPEEAGPASGGKGNAGGKGKAGAASSSAKKAAAAASSRDAFLMVLPDEDDDEEEEEEEDEGGGGGGGGGKNKRGATWEPEHADDRPVSHLLPEIHHPAFSLRLLRNCLFLPP